MTLILFPTFLTARSKETIVRPGVIAHVHQTLAVFAVFASITCGQQECASVASIKDYSLIGNVYKTTSGKSLMTCIITCDQDPNCYSLNYRFPSSTCELSSATRYLHLPEFVFTPDSVYLDHLTRPSGSCSDNWPCKNEGKCVNIARAPGFKCECRHEYIGDTCEVCSSPPLGMQDGRISDRELKSSSNGMWLNLQTFKPSDSRLMRSGASWVSAVLDVDPWLQISFSPKVKVISGIATQGNPSHDWWTTRYTIKYGMTGKSWKHYCEKDGKIKVFSANSDGSGVVKHQISPTFTASFIRVVPGSKSGRTALRLELYGCDFISD